MTIYNNTIQYNTIQYNTIQYNTIQYNTIQYNDKAPIDFNQTEGRLGHHSIMQHDPAVPGIQKLQP
jgi:hypothetical protein